MPTLKIYYEDLDEIRRINTSAVSRWNNFLSQTTKIVGNSKFDVYYKDDDADLIKVLTEWEWEEALDILQQQNLGKIYIKNIKKLKPPKTNKKKTCSPPKDKTQEGSFSFCSACGRVTMIGLLLILFFICLTPVFITRSPNPGTISEKEIESKVQKLEFLAYEQLRNRHFDKAEKLYYSLLDVKPKHSLALYNLACVQALLGKKTDALATLRRAIEDADYMDLEHMKKDPDLNILRDSKEFYILVQMLEKKRMKKRFL